jgi:signal peptidase I
MLSILAVLMAIPAFAQVGGNDWKATNGEKFTWTHTLADGTTVVQHYEILYSPSTVVRNGDIVTFTIQTVYVESVPTTFYSMNLNCRTQQYTYASYDLSKSPAVLSAPSVWKNIMPNSAGSVTEPFFCGK